MVIVAVAAFSHLRPGCNFIPKNFNEVSFLDTAWGAIKIPLQFSYQGHLQHLSVHSVTWSRNNKWLCFFYCIYQLENCGLRGLPSVQLELSEIHFLTDTKYELRESIFDASVNKFCQWSKSNLFTGTSQIQTSHTDGADIFATLRGFLNLHPISR